MIKILTNQETCLKFEEFLESICSIENFNFWSDLQMFRQLESHSDKKKKAFQICRTYLIESSPSEINLDYELKKSLYEELSQNFSVTEMGTLGKTASSELSKKRVSVVSVVGDSSETFNAAQEAIFRLLLTDSLPKFQKSSLYPKDKIDAIDQNSAKSRFGRFGRLLSGGSTKKKSNETLLTSQ